MLILLEGAVLCLVFTALIVPFTLKNPAASIGDYPPAIRKRCAEPVPKRWQNTATTAFTSASPASGCCSGSPSARRSGRWWPCSKQYYRNRSHPPHIG